MLEPITFFYHQYVLLCHSFSFHLKLAPGGRSHVPLADQQEDGEETDVSLITGALRSHDLLVREPPQPTCGSSVVLRNQTMTVANTNSAGMLHRTRCLLSFPHIHMFIVEFRTNTVIFTPCACKHFKTTTKIPLHFTVWQKHTVLYYTPLILIILHFCICAFSFQHLSWLSEAGVV